MLYCILIILSMANFSLKQKDSLSFESAQLRNERVAIAYQEKYNEVRNLFINKQVDFPPSQVFFRAFKLEKEFEVWSFSAKTNKFVLIKSFPICQSSGVLGPKRKEGDLQVPEGFYNIVVFNPVSNYFLSLGINYPNSSDSILTSNKNAPGGDIYIHGNCLSIGCIPLTDEYIKEVYIIATMAKNSGQEDIPVHIFPFKFNNTLYNKYLANYNNIELRNFWYNLKEGYSYFELNKQLPKISITKYGKYSFN